MSRLVSLAVIILSIPACAASPTDEDGRDDSFLGSGKADTGGVVEGSPEAIGVLRVANEVSLEALVEPSPDGVGLTQRVADNIGAIRLGDDGLPGTADDGTFTTLAQLDAVPFVGPIAFHHMLDYARAQGWVVPHSHVDTAAPTLRGVTFSPQSLDLSNGPQELTISLDIADDLSGVDSVTVGINYRMAGPAIYNPGTNRWEARLTATNWAPGDYGLTWFDATDHAWNEAMCAASSQCGAVPLYATLVSVVNNGTVDTTVPQVVEASFSQPTIDVSQAMPVQTITIATTDDVGATALNLDLTPEAYNAPIHVMATPTQPAGTFQATVAMPPWSEPGRWQIGMIDLTDASSNRIVYGPTPYEFTVVNPGVSDNTPPLLRAMAFSSTGIDVTNGAQSVVLSLQFAADAAGTAEVSVTLNIGNAYRTIDIKNPVVDAAGNLGIPIDVPRYLPSGTLRVWSVLLTSGNGRLNWGDSDHPTMAGVDIRTATVQVTNGG